MNKAEIIRQETKADGLFRPRYLGERDAWICERYRKAENKEYGSHATPAIVVETWGARLDGPKGQRFSPLFIFNEADAQKQCDMLNGGRQ